MLAARAAVRDIRPQSTMRWENVPVLQTDDEEAAKEEEEEALRLQREQQAALRPEDYDDSHLFPDADGAAASSSEDEESDQDAEVALGDVAAAQVCSSKTVKSYKVTAKALPVPTLVALSPVYLKKTG